MNIFKIYRRSHKTYIFYICLHYWSKNNQDIYRALSVIAEESDFIQSEPYKNSNFIQPRNQKILYYDRTNYYFEIEEERGLKHYEKSKENPPNPIVCMELFMDSDGIPLAFDIFPSNQNEQTTLKPPEKKIIKDCNCSEFIFCSDTGLGRASNRAFNSIKNRAYAFCEKHYCKPRFCMLHDRFLLFNCPRRDCKISVSF